MLKEKIKLANSDSSRYLQLIDIYPYESGLRARTITQIQHVLPKAIGKQPNTVCLKITKKHTEGFPQRCGLTLEGKGRFIWNNYKR